MTNSLKLGGFMVACLTTAPTAGSYRNYLDCQPEGVVRTAAFSERADR